MGRLQTKNLFEAKANQPESEPVKVCRCGGRIQIEKIDRGMRAERDREKVVRVRNRRIERYFKWKRSKCTYRWIRGKGSKDREIL